jgi:hypothetical protein
MLIMHRCILLLLVDADSTHIRYLLLMLRPSLCFHCWLVLVQWSDVRAFPATTTSSGGKSKNFSQQAATHAYAQHASSSSSSSYLGTVVL